MIINHLLSNKWQVIVYHDDIIKWKHFPRYRPFVWGIHRSPVNSLHKGQWHGALMLSLIYVWINDWVNNHEADDLRCYRAHYDVSVMSPNKENIAMIQFFFVQSCLPHSLKPWHVFLLAAQFMMFLQISQQNMMTSSNGNIFCVTGHLCREFTGPRWIPCTKASDIELRYFLWSTSE